MYDFGVEYVGKQHAEHLATIFKKCHNSTEDWEGKEYAGIDLKWDYEERTCWATMDGYILELRTKFQHMQPKKIQFSPHKHRPIDYGATQQLVKPTDTSQPLNEKIIKRIQGIIGALLYVGRAVNKKLLVTLSAIGAQQASATEDTAAAIEKLLDCVATYPNDGILFRKSDMILAAHADAGFLNESQARRRACPKFQKNSSNNTTSSAWCIKVGYISKSVVGAMAYPNLACWQTSNSD